MPVVWLHLPMTEWIQQYAKSFVHPDKLQQTVDSFMQDYDKRKEEVKTAQLFLWNLLHPGA